ncbi:MAG: LacI family DNA-binding transcriptional regulator [Elusimicrobiota bacterium]
MSVTIKDVAKKSKVSVATVSRVVNNIQHEKVSEATRAKVLVTVKELGYRPNLAARSLSKQITSHIGLFLPFSKGLFADNYYSLLLQGIISEINNHRYSLTLYDANLLAKDFTVPLREKQVDGLLIVGPPENQLKKLLPYAKQLIMLSATYNMMGFSTIDCDNISGAEMAVEYLLGLGHRAIGIITGPDDIVNSRDRVKGFCLAMRKRGISVDSELIANGEFIYSKGVQAARKLLGAKPRPTAIFCANDTMAFACIQVAAEMGISVPGDLSVAGFDDVEMASEARPALTTIRQPISEIGKQGVRMLFAQMDIKVFKPQNIVLPVELIVRESCNKCEAAKVISA